VTLVFNFSAEITDDSLFLDSQNTNKLDDFVVKITFRKLMTKCVKVQQELVALANEVGFTFILDSNAAGAGDAEDIAASPSNFFLVGRK